MKSLSIKSLMAVALFTCLLGCKTVMVFKSQPGKPGNSANAPGQVKKSTGSQSAKPFAPGQQKKKN